jgi:hypothetical protein
MNNEMVWLPFEVVACDEHGFKCGGDHKARHDLPSFSKSEQAMSWMVQPANNHIHSRDGNPVRLQWVEHTLEEAVEKGFTLPKGDMH